MAIVDVAPRASADVDDILIHSHGLGGRSAADRMQADFKAAALLLANHPEIGRRRADIGLDLRSILVVLHRFDRARDTVFVLRVLHSRRRLSVDAT